jgi:hypothetical protein
MDAKGIGVKGDASDHCAIQSHKSKRKAVKIAGFIVLLLVLAAEGPAISQIHLTPNEIAANGPLPGDMSLYQSELSCAETMPAAGYFSSINAAELADAQRSGVFPCATFLGSLTGENVVYASRNEDSYQGVTFVNNRLPGELYLTGGNTPPLTGLIPAGPYVAKVDATTGKQIWRTFLDNGNVSRDWIATTNLNILSNGKVVNAGAQWVVLLDPDTGRVLKQTTLPTGTVPPQDISFKKVTVAPDGTIILVSQARPQGSTLQGSFAWVEGFLEGKPIPPSVIVAVDPDSLKVLDWVQMPDASIPAHIVTTFEGKFFIYATGVAKTYRYLWDPKTKKLSQDTSWVATYLTKGQTPGAAPGVLGDWVVIQTNGVAASAPSTIVAISQKDATNIKSITPFGALQPGQISWCNPKASVDIENNMVYSADLGVGKVAGIRIDPHTGDMKTVFVVDDWTFTFQPLIGPKDQRVLLLTNMRFGHVDTQKPVSKEDLQKALLLGDYEEQLTWRDTVTGRILAQSDFFERLSPGSLTTPGFGGRVYFPTGTGFMVLQVLPKPSSLSK